MSAWEFADLAGDLGLIRLGGLDGGEAEGEAVEIVLGAVGGLAVFFDGAEQLGHGAVETVGEPVAFEFWAGVAARGEDGDFLFGEAGAGAENSSAGAGDVGGVLLAEFYVGVEDESGLGILEFDAGLSEKIGGGALGGRFGE